MTILRLLATALVCAAGIIVGDLVFRSSLLRAVRPVILTPMSRAAVEPPVQVAWDGPRRMRVLLTAIGDQQRDLGVRQSPVVLDAGQFPRAGGYRLELEAPTFGKWIRASRFFQVHAGPDRKTPEVALEKAPERRDRWRALSLARAARDKAQARGKTLRDESAALREENDRLSKQVDTLAQTQEEDAAHLAELERRVAQLTEENRSLADEITVTRQRLGSVVPCTVWGYYSFPRPQTVPVTRRILMVGDTSGRVFRSQLDCEILRRGDVTAASICFCVGNSWGG